MEARKDEREPSNIPELIKHTKCEQRSCPNYDHNCLVMPGQKHFSLTANDFCNWNKAIDMGKATLDLPPLNIRGSPVGAKKSQVAITQNTTNTAVPFPFSFMPGFPMSGYTPPYFSLSSTHTIFTCGPWSPPCSCSTGSDHASIQLSDRHRF